MPSRSLSVVVQQMRAAAEQDGAGRTDGEFLTRFLTRKDDEALAALVERHAPMVWGVCCRLLRNPLDAEDAFQTTFLVLVRKAATVLPREMLANWLYGVAQQTAVRLRSISAKRGWREMQMNEIPEPVVDEARDNELLTLLDQELSRLPARFRALIVLCDLEGNSRKEVARQLGCPEGTVASRLSRARDMLAKRMTRHGLAISGGSLATVITQSAGSAGVPISVVSRTIHVATLLAANQAVGVISGPVAALTEGVLKTMLLKKIMSTTMVVLALGVAVITGGRLAIGHTKGSGKPTFAADSKPLITEKPVQPAKETSTVQNRAEVPPIKEGPKALKVVVRLVDDATGQPITKASWQWGWANPKKRGEFYFGHRGGESRTSDGTHEMQFQTTPETNLFRFRVVAAGYEPAEVVEEFPNPLPASLERTVRVKPGRRVAGTLRDHKGKPIANGQVYFIPKEDATVSILEGVSDRASVSDARMDAQGKFELPTSGAGKLAASTEAVDLWLFALPPEGAAADLTLPAPAYMVLDLDYWYFDGQGKPDVASDRPEECRILVQGHGDGTMLWAGLEYHRQMLVYSRDPKAKLARGVRVENAAAQPAGGTARNRHVSAKVRIALPPGQYFVQRTTSAGPYHPKGIGIVTLTAGAETPLDWKTRPGAAVRGVVKLPANHQFIQQPGAAPRKLDWTVPGWAYVHIDAADGKRRGSAKIQHDGSFLIAAHLEPGRYKVHTWITFPPKDNIDRGSEFGRPPDLDGTQEFVIPEPPADPAVVQPVNVEVPLKIHGNRIVPAPINPQAAHPKPKPNYVTVVGQLLDDATGQPIEKAGWEWGQADPKKPEQIAWGHSRQSGGNYPGGKFEMLVNIGANGHHYPLRVYSAGYETTIVVDDLAKPYPEKIERIVRLKRGRNITGVLRDHTGKPVANGWVFFIPQGHRTNIVEGIPGTDAHELPGKVRDGAVAEVRTNANGTFALSTGAAGTLAASTDLVDLWPFPLPEDGQADLKMPAPSHLVIDLTYWYLDELVKKGPHELSPNSEDPNQCWLAIDREWSAAEAKSGLSYRRQMLVFAKDPRAKLSKGVIVSHVYEGEMPQPIPGVGHNKNLSTKIRVALPAGSYRVQRLRAGPFAPVGEQQVVLKPGEDTVVSWARGDGSSVRGKATWPANLMFVRQQGEKPRKLDWTVPDTATVWIAPVGADGKVSKPIEAAKIQPDGSFFIATNLDPGKYKATARVYLPEGDFRGGRRGSDCEFSQEFTVPDPARGPFGSPPVKVEIKMHVGVGGRFVATDPPAAPAKP